MQQPLTAHTWTMEPSIDELPTQPPLWACQAYSYEAASEESQQRLAAFLEHQGFQVEYPAYGLDTAFEAKIGTGGR